MTFLPKSQYIKKFTKGNELVYKNNQSKSYKGPYIEIKGTLQVMIFLI